jgi:hypothetical protein
MVGVLEMKNKDLCGYCLTRFPDQQLAWLRLIPICEDCIKELKTKKGKRRKPGDVFTLE